MIILDEFAIQTLDKVHKINLINSLPGVKSVNLIGTKDFNGLENLAIFSTVTHLGSHPPLIGFVHRPKSEYSHTIMNIEATGVYTINNVHQGILQNAHNTSEKHPKEVSEFAACALTPEYFADFHPPFVKECFVKFGLELREILQIKLNGTFLVIGEVKVIILNKNLVEENYLINNSKSGVVGALGVAQYFSEPKKMVTII
jgi:flavin reductase (DIM6/NTAB) family NADH-FMN oxidoreductase RutF